jgi:hypothetical protein
MDHWQETLIFTRQNTVKVTTPSIRVDSHAGRSVTVQQLFFLYKIKAFTASGLAKGHNAGCTLIPGYVFIIINFTHFVIQDR